ncbi:hypothetical protein V5799_029819 [Amblyomma americanum]|uniref:Uncharacterized protein n=1 Tax=Amblyomma americanum TaxID=6943 RepID=A0AAQ4EQ71_AMBAM
MSIARPLTPEVKQRNCFSMPLYPLDQSGFSSHAGAGLSAERRLQRYRVKRQKMASAATLALSSRYTEVPVAASSGSSKEL